VFSCIFGCMHVRDNNKNEDEPAFEREIKHFLPRYEVKGVQYKRTIYEHDGVIGELRKEVYYLPKDDIEIIVSVNNTMIVNVELCKDGTDRGKT